MQWKNSLPNGSVTNSDIACWQSSSNTLPPKSLTIWDSSVPTSRCILLECVLWCFHFSTVSTQCECCVLSTLFFFHCSVIGCPFLYRSCTWVASPRCLFTEISYLWKIRCFALEFSFIGFSHSKYLVIKWMQSKLNATCLWGTYYCGSVWLSFST